MTGEMASPCAKPAGSWVHALSLSLVLLGFKLPKVETAHFVLLITFLKKKIKNKIKKL